MLDRFHSHTQKCRKCLKSLAVVKTVKTIVTLLSCGLIGFAVFMARLSYIGLEHSKWRSCGALIGALVFGFVAQKISHLESLYYFRDYEHWKTWLKNKHGFLVIVMREVLYFVFHSWARGFVWLLGLRSEKHCNLSYLPFLTSLQVFVQLRFFYMLWFCTACFDC